MQYEDLTIKWISLDRARAQMMVSEFLLAGELVRSCDIVF